MAAGDRLQDAILLLHVWLGRGFWLFTLFRRRRTQLVAVGAVSLSLLVVYGLLRPTCCHTGRCPRAHSSWQQGLPGLPGASHAPLEANDEYYEEDVVDASREAAVEVARTSPPPAPATKTVWATRRPVSGHDYHCEDSDGPSSEACQIRCTAPCVEPFRLCMAHEACHLVALNTQGTFATLKTSLPGHARYFAARACKNLKDWHAWLGETVAGREMLSGDAATSAASVAAGALDGPPPRLDGPRAVYLSLVGSHGRDFACAESDGAVTSACQVKCTSRDCAEGWRRCVLQPRCEVVQMNAEWTWATLKLGDGSTRAAAAAASTGKGSGGGGGGGGGKVSHHAFLVAVPNETAWREQHHAKRVAARGGSVGGGDGTGKRSSSKPAVAAKAAAAVAAKAAAAAVAADGEGEGGEDASDDDDNAASNASVAEWREALSSVSAGQSDEASAAAAGGVAAAGEDPEHAQHRPIMLSVDDVKRHDFGCAADVPSDERSGAVGACQINCGGASPRAPGPPGAGGRRGLSSSGGKASAADCVEPYRRCLAHRRCVAVHVNNERTYGTLKSSVQDGQEIIVVLSEGEWKAQLGAGPFERARRAFPHGRGARAGMMMNHPTPYWRIEHEHQAHARGAFGWL